MEMMETVRKKKFEDIITENFLELKTDMKLQNEKSKSQHRKKIVSNPREKILLTRE